MFSSSQCNNELHAKDERKHHVAVDKSSNNRSMLRMVNAFVMLKIGPIRLALVGLTAGWQSVRQKSCCFRNFL